MIDEVVAVLQQGGIENAHREARWLLEVATNLDQAVGLAHRRAAGEPLQYLTGVAGFRYLELEVGPGVLIPRPETELVAERALDVLPDDGSLVDVGTGSGAIALSVAHERPGARVWATDVSGAALEWARRNRDRLGAKVELVEGDLLNPLPDQLRGTIDVVVSNPPYVGEDERAALPRDVVEHEPHVALFASDGLEIIRRLALDAPGWLRPGGWLVVEISERHPDEVTEILHEASFAEVLIDQDLNGRARIATGRFYG